MSESLRPWDEAVVAHADTERNEKFPGLGFEPTTFLPRGYSDASFLQWIVKECGEQIVCFYCLL